VRVPDWAERSRYVHAPGRRGRKLSVHPTAISAITAMVAPVVLITAGGILTNGLLAVYGAVNDRMRDLNHEARDIVTGPDRTLRTTGQLAGSEGERLTEIYRQLPLLLRRHQLIHYAILLIFAGLGVLVLGVIAIAAAVTGNSDAIWIAALALVLAGTVVILGGLICAARSLAMSRNAIEYEVNRTLSRGADK
jgi:hypothetical protein